MIPVVQLVVGDGKDGRPSGDCFRACLASILEMRAEDVPHFVGDNEASWFRDAKRWLARFGLTLEWRSHDLADSPRYWPNGWWIASVTSENFEGAGHAVVMRGTDIDHDGDDWTAVAHDPSPHPRRTPYRFSGATVITALDPARIARAAKAALP